MMRLSVQVSKEILDCSIHSLLEIGSPYGSKGCQLATFTLKKTHRFRLKTPKQKTLELNTNKGGKI
jgi:hypothetical protein